MKIARYVRNLFFAMVMVAVPASSFAGIFFSIGIAPPPLPVYEQPPCPYDGYLWTPGYWSWSDDGGYYWVPGTWVQPPQVGFLWTPGYWGYNNGFYGFNQGYWGSHIGFYGGVNYGFGYGGSGFEGGYWNNGRFAYNRSVTNVSNTNITNVYNHTVINNTTVNNRTSFNGGTGGIQARPTPQEAAAVRENHVQPTSMQLQHATMAQKNPELRASVNGGKPAIAATARPNDFKSAIPARQAGGQVNTAVYKAAATNGGKLPPNMKDPGASNGQVNRPVTSPVNGAVNTTRPAAGGNLNRPGTPNNATRPVTGNQVRPVTSPANGNIDRTPATRPAPTTQPAPTTRPNYQENRPAVQQPRPQVQQPQVQQPRPQVQQPRPQVEQPRPQVQQPRPQVQQSRPQVQQARPQPAPRPAPQHEEHPKR